MQHNSFLWLLAVLTIYFVGICLFRQLKAVALNYLFYTNVGLNPDANTLWMCVRQTKCQTYLKNYYKLSWLGFFEASIAAIYSLCLVFIYINHGFNLQAILIGAFFTLLMLLSLIDRYTFLLPDALIAPLTVLGALNAILFMEDMFFHLIFGFVSGYLFLQSLNFIFLWVYKKQAFGAGDVKLLAAIGVWLGAASIPLVMCIACMVNALFAVIQQRSLKPKGCYPFGPFIAIGAIVTLIYTKYVLI